MSQSWRIVYYETLQGSTPVLDFIENLNVRVQAKMARTFDLLEQFGISLGALHVKKLVGTRLWEMRIIGNDNIRIFYIASKQKSFLLLHGFVKKRPKTDRKEIKTALERFQEFNSRSKY